MVLLQISFSRKIDKMTEIWADCHGNSVTKLYYISMINRAGVEQVCVSHL